MTDRRRQSVYQQRYPRLARVNELLREVLADELERIGDSDESLGMLTITGVTCDPALRHAQVYFSSLDEATKSALEQHRVHLQSVIANQVRMKRTPQLAFEVDESIVSGERVDQILKGLHDNDEAG